jgi:hypothetical protein
MNLNYDMAKFVDPKIQIAPRELPVEAMMKVGNVLQDRFDKAMENETKTQAFIRKLKSSSNPADHAVADQIMSNYNERQKDRATNGRYQDMQWQTQQDALDVAGMYEGLSNRAKQIAEYEKAIDLNTVNSPEIKKLQKEKYRKSIMQSQFDPEKRILQGLDVSAPNIVNAFDYEKHMMDLAGQWKPDTRGSKTVKEVWIPRGAKAPDGSISPGSNYKVLDNRFTEQVKAEDLRNHLEKSALSNEMLQAALKQDREVYGDDVAFKRYHNAINAAIDAKAYIKQLENEHSAEMTAPKVVGGGGGGGYPTSKLSTLLAPSEYTRGDAPTPILNPNTNPNLPQDLIQKGVLGGKGVNTQESRDNFNMLLESLDNGIETSTSKVTKQRFKDAKNLFIDYRNLVQEYPEYKQTLSEIHSREPGYAIHNLFNKFGAGLESIVSLSSDRVRHNNFLNKVKKIEDNYRNYIGQGFQDTDVENQIQNYFRKGAVPVSTSVPMITASGGTPEIEKELKNLGEKINPKDVKVYQADEGFNEKGKMDFIKVSTEPRGNGTGHLFEVRQVDKDGNVKTALVEMNKEGRNDALQNLERAIYKDTNEHVLLSETNMFKHTRPFKAENEQRNISEILEENKLTNSPAYFEFSKGKYKDTKIVKVSGGYKIPGVKAIGVNEQGEPVLTDQDEVFSSYIQAIQSLL